MTLYGVWVAFEPARWLADVTGFDLVTPDPQHALGIANEHGAATGQITVIKRYDMGHFFCFVWCTKCKAPYRTTRWCPHANPSPEVEAAIVARRLWDGSDEVAALTVEANEGREPHLELLDRLYERDMRGLRSKAEALAKIAVGR